VSFAPASFLEVDLLKSYQVGRDRGPYQITEYTTLSAMLTRYLRHGVDTRLSANRTWFQQSTQTAADNPLGKYTLDTYYGSVALSPIGYLKTLLDLSISHNSAPLVANQRFQVSRSANVQMFFTQRLEGRLNAVWIDQSEHFRLDNTFSQNYNAGLTYYPGANINLNLSYIYTSITTDTRNNSGTFAGFFGYSFRRAFSLYLSLNRQRLESQPSPGGSTITEKAVLKPYSLNAQVQLYLSAKATLTLGYLYAKTTSTTVLRTVENQYQAILNIQF
jgi:hypothetical protein